MKESFKAQCYCFYLIETVISSAIFYSVTSRNRSFEKLLYRDTLVIITQVLHEFHLRL